MPDRARFCLFDSFISNLLHRARRAMAAAGFSELTFSYPGPARVVIVGYPRTPSPRNPLDKRKRGNAFASAEQKKDKGKAHLEGGACSILFLACT